MTANSLLISDLPWPRSKSVRELLLAAGASAAFVIGSAAGRPVHIGSATDVRQRLSQLGSAPHRPTTLYGVAWAYGTAARRIVAAAVARLALYRTPGMGNWFDIAPATAIRVVHEQASAIGAPLVDHETFLNLIERQAAEAAAAPREAKIVTADQIDRWDASQAEALDDFDRDQEAARLIAAMREGMRLEMGMTTRRAAF